MVRYKAVPDIDRSEADHRRACLFVGDEKGGEKQGGENLDSKHRPVNIGKVCAPCHHAAPSHKAGPE